MKLGFKPTGEEMNQFNCSVKGNFGFTKATHSQSSFAALARCTSFSFHTTSKRIPNLLTK